MLNFTTKEFSITQNEYFRILFRRHLEKRWWVFVLIFLFSILGYEAGVLSVILLFTTLLTLYMIYVLARCYLISNPKDNGFVFRERYYEIDADFITSHLKDGSLIKIKFSDITKAIKGKEYFILYLTKFLFFYLPFNQFNDPAHVPALETLLKVKAIQ